MQGGFPGSGRGWQDNPSALWLQNFKVLRQISPFVVLFLQSLWDFCPSLILSCREEVFFPEHLSFMPVMDQNLPRTVLLLSLLKPRAHSGLDPLQEDVPRLNFSWNSLPAAFRASENLTFPDFLASPGGREEEFSAIFPRGEQCSCNSL